jgi:glycosyltransferase involved in cell wall biosynthesis
MVKKVFNRILYINNTADIYGASRSLLRMLPEMRDAGYEPVVVVPEEGPLKERLEGAGISVHVEPQLAVITRTDFKSWRILLFLYRFPVSVIRLWRLIARERISLVHTNTGVILSPAVAAWLARVPHFWHIRDSFEEFRFVWRVYARYIMFFSRKVIANSASTARQFPPSEKMVVIYNGVDLAEFELDAAEAGKAFRAQFGLGNALVVGCVGRIKFIRKGQEVLVEAAKLLKERGVAAKHVIVGSTAPGNEEHLTRLRTLIKDLGVENEVLLAGELGDVRPAYAAMDVLVLPSAQTEPFGNVISEAMAMGVPVVATALGGALEQVVDGQTGFLIPPGSAAELAGKVSILLKDRGLRERMGAKGRERLRECFSLQSTVTQMKSVYRTVLDN